MSFLTKLLDQVGNLSQQGKEMAAFPTSSWVSKWHWTQGLQITTLSLDADLHSPNQVSLITLLQPCPPHPGLTPPDR